MSRGGLMRSQAFDENVAEMRGDDAIAETDGYGMGRAREKGSGDGAGSDTLSSWSMLAAGLRRWAGESGQCLCILLDELRCHEESDLVKQKTATAARQEKGQESPTWP